ncbi:integumentary mucin C.1 [Drosophila albomicans]|uniref:Integumentary mucin C.1 n=1 Tax=Drosophila albomicans TaxID=7291 RepID=A0A6P8XBC1_DROAB|nr:integumentary mucin C.1 [Drosophila albomicans]
MNKIGILVLLLVAMIGQALSQSQCQVCQSDNQVSCESESTYYICLGERRYGPYSCEANEVCTNSADICVDKSLVTGSIINVCGDDESACQSCPDNKKYTCVSSTQAARCVNGEVSTSLIIDCAEDEICVSEAETTFKNVCVPNCAADFAQYNATCSNAVYTPPTQAPPTTPSPTEVLSICQEAAETKTTRYFFAYVDSTCRTYVYCEKASLTSTTFTQTFTGGCSSPTPYFNTATSKCQATISDSCRTEAPTTTQAPTTTTTTAAGTSTTASSTSEATTSTTTDEPVTVTDEPTEQ